MENFTFYHLNGKREVLQGDDPQDAWTKAGYGAGAIHAIDFYVNGDDRSYERVDKEWVRKVPIFNP